MREAQKTGDQGFSSIELLMVTGAIALLAGIAITLIGNTRSGVKNVKLRHEVETLNEAVQVYLGNGGSMKGIDTVPAALAKLKTSAAGDDAIVGLGGSLLDPRYRAEMLPASELGSSVPRALWDETKQRFVYANSGAGGAKRFYIDADSADEDPLEEARQTALSYATQTNWVWDYTDVQLAAGGEVATISGDGPGTGGYTSFDAPPAVRLDPPTFSVDGGTYSFFDFDLEVELNNPNPVGTSVVYYTLDNSQWQVYGGGSVAVSAGQELTAYSVSIDPDAYENSVFATEIYQSSFTISGGSGGDFMNPQGPGGMVTNLGGGDSDSYFSFGTAAGTPDPSWLLFNGGSFVGVDAEESFLLGSIDYFNGTILAGTEATGVGLSIDLNFSGGPSLTFDYEFELLSTVNLAENTPEENADIVRIGDLYAGVPVDLGGVSYSLVLEFGETTAGGFSTIDQFHVLEGESASGNLYGRLVEVSDEDDEDDDDDD